MYEILTQFPGKLCFPSFRHILEEEKEEYARIEHLHFILCLLYSPLENITINPM